MMAVTELEMAVGQDSSLPEGGGTPLADHPEKVTSPPIHRHAWSSTYRKWLLATDFVLTAVTIIGSLLLRGNFTSYVTGLSGVRYVVLLPVFVLGWMAVLALVHAYDRKVIGIGLQEYRQVAIGTFAFYGAIAILSYCFKIQLSRFLFFVGLPVGIILLILGRWICRQVLNAKRSKGWVTPSLVIGHARAISEMLSSLHGETWSGYQPVVICLVGDDSDKSATALKKDHPEFDFTSMSGIDALLAQGAIGAVMEVGGLSQTQVRRLEWLLEKYNVDFFVSPTMADIATSRKAMRMAEGLSFIHVQLPEFTGWKLVAKRVFDILFSSVVLVIGSPIYLIIAIAVKLGDGGPVFFSQERVGLNGTPFTMHKFRTMCVDAEARLTALQIVSGQDKLLFKMEDDPRITKVGRFLRKYSLDELPQFWDVLRGPMSVVGPRPALQREVEKYEKTHHHRRFLVKPGITGPWQVGGRSDLTMDQYFGIDLDYVENWSLILDILIVLKTVRTVLQHDGAY